MHPQKVYQYLPKENTESKFKFYCLMKEDKYKQFDQQL